MPAQRTRDTPLEVSTGAPLPQPPALSIIAPTPRAFTFPLAHNLSDSPYSSPSNSPFEPDLRHSFASSSSSIVRSLSPDSTSIPTPPPTTTLHKRRKSSSDVEHRPKKGDDDYVKRPENAFILFRRKCVEDRLAAEEAAAAGIPAKKQRQADLSKMISQQWKGLEPKERQYWENMAKEKKREHEQLHPGYVYRPQRTKKSKARRSTKGDEDIGRESVQFILPAPATRQHGRSASAPTPPPYQTFNIPNIFGSSGSCPTSPSLLPLIARRASNPEEAMSTFDYIPRDSLMPPPTFAPVNYEMYGQQQQMRRSDGGANLPSPLTLVDEHGMLLQGHAMISPASSVGSASSGPGSPNSAPFTPTTGMLSHHFSEMSALDSSSCEAMSQADLHEQQMQMQMYQQDLDLAGYAWDATSIWGPTDLLIAEDFDINSIPPIELGIPKFDEHMVMGGHAEFADGVDYSQGNEYSQSLGDEQSFDDSRLGGGLVDYDHMMAAKSY